MEINANKEVLHSEICSDSLVSAHVSCSERERERERERESSMMVRRQFSASVILMSMAMNLLCTGELSVVFLNKCVE